MKLRSVCIFAKLIKGALFVSYCLDPSRRMTLKENSRNTVRHWDDFERKIREIPLASVARKKITASTRHNYADQHSFLFASVNCYLLKTSE